MKKRNGIFFLFLLVAAQGLLGQNFSRVLEIKNRRMNGQDVRRIQNRLLSLGFKKLGEADGWYGPLTAGTVKTLQGFLGFPRDGRVTMDFWNVVFDAKQEALLKNISAIDNYNQNLFKLTNKRTGTDADFDDILSSTLNGEVKIVLFQHINEGLPIFRFKVYYLADIIFIVQDVYYGDYRTRIFMKNAYGLFELRNGVPISSDPALEGILKRIQDHLAAAP
ncbi:MAG: peptidoglycan-binding protein [Spirochaetaceae bacterium]|jgi:peptidoglycan hydrolase-like protein with peptidoglycan-binding domain|nr:peptidoglycan-binding protein [Spirochaetaceae bacterium]